MTTFPFSSTPARAVRLIVVALALMLVVAAFAASPAHAAGIVVNDAGDTTGACATSGTGTCTLRDAITFANSTPGADTITFSISNATILLTADLTHVTGDVTIDGTTQNITVDGQALHAILRTDAAITLNVNALTFYRGDNGPTGGGALLLNNALAVANVTNSTFLSNASSSFGGAVASLGTLNIANSTFSGNTGAVGGAIYAASGATVTVTNSTLSGNTSISSGAIFSNGAGTTVTLYNTIVADSTGGDCNTNSGGAITADAYNIDSDGTCNNATTKTTAQIALGALASNGGPTQTMAIDNTSAAFNTGNNAVCAAAPVNNLDQRGTTRPQGAICDVGAYEFVYTGGQTGPNFVVNTTADTDDGSCDILGQGIGNQDCTLREAINAANAFSGADTITFDIPATDSGCTAANTCTITLGDRLPIIVDPLTIDGAPNNGRITVDGAGSYTVFDAEANFNLNALTVKNGAALFKGGGLNISPGDVDVLVSNSTFVNNLAQGGGHIKNRSSGTVTIVNSTFFDTPSTGIGSSDGAMLIYNSTLDGNNQGGGSGVEVVSGALALYNTIVVNHGASDCILAGGTLTADSFNIDEDGTCDNATSKTLAELDLQALADNGGPTWTMAIDDASAAFNTGDNAVCAAAPVNNLDQRGAVRPYGASCDVGAYEYNPGAQTGPNFVVNSAADTDDGSCDLLGDGVGNQDCTLREAINAANGNSGADTITFDIPGTDGGCTAANTCTITLGDRLPIIRFDPLTIDGAPNNGRITVDGAGSYTVFDAESDFNLNALTVKNGSALLKGGGLNISSGDVDVLVSNSTFVNNFAQGGGHIKNRSSGTVTIVNSTFFDTPSTGIGSSDGAMLIYNSTLDGNNQTGGSGAEVVSGALALYNTIVVNHGASDCILAGGTLTADSFNIDEDGTCDSATSKTLAELDLQALADNGGPTWTMAIDDTSAAFNAGDNAVCAAAPVNGLDQRGVTRPQGPQCDVGAYEAAVSCPAFPISVANEAELNTAIGCYNAETVAGSYTISVTQGISLTASTTTIDNATSGVELVIEGGGYTVDGQDISGVRPFEVQLDTTVTINNVTVTGGNAVGELGGGILNRGNLTLNDSTVSGNQTDAEGGGIGNRAGGTLTINNSTISGNVAPNGGGLVILSPATINNSTISGNSSGIGNGGGIRNVNNLTLDSVTITDNQAANGSGIYHESLTLNVTNSILAGNWEIFPTLAGPDCETDGSGFQPVVDGGHNLVQRPGDCGFTNGVNGTIVGQGAQIGPLANNGGPTQTHLPQAASPAIDAGNTALTTDQRGVARPQGSADDIGAVEASCPAFPVSVANEGELNFAIACYNAETVAGSYTISVTQSISLTASTTAIDNATSGVALVIEGNGHTVDGQGTSGVRPFTIEDDTTVTLKTMTITGGNVTDFGGGIENSGTLTVLNSTISHNHADKTGGGIDNSGMLYVVNSTVSHNEASNQTNLGAGGGIWNGDTLTVVNSTISDNAAWSFGGGIDNTPSSALTLHNSIVANNTAPGGADCQANFGGTYVAQNSLVETGTIGDGCLLNGANNLTGDPNLGPLQNNGGPTETHALLNSSIAINAGANTLAVVPPANTPLTTDQRGAGYPRINAGTVDMGAYEAACSAFPVGVATEGQLNYAIACYNAKTVAGSYTIVIVADIDLTASTTTIDNATSGVELVIEGGGYTVDGQGASGVRPFTIEDDTTVTLKTMTITGGNVTDFGGGIENSGTLTVLNSTISGNSAGNTGGGIDNGGTLYVVNSTVSHNVASNQADRGLGGGIFNGGTLLVTNSTVSDNQSYLTGGGIQNGAFGSTLTLHNSIVANNTASSSADCFNLLGTATAQNSLVETGTPGSGCLNGPNNLTGDPNLGPLQNNGGPTETHALLTGSIAINAGANALAVDPDGNPLTTDQRGPGFLRILGGTVDMGAYETISSPTAVTLSGLEAASQQQAVLAWPWLLVALAAALAMAAAWQRRSHA